MHVDGGSSVGNPGAAPDDNVMTLHPEERFAACSLLPTGGLNAQVAGSDTVLVSVNS